MLRLNRDMLRLDLRARFIVQHITKSCFVGTLLASGGAFADAETHFDPKALRLPGSNQDIADLSVFDEGGQLPGHYLVDIYLNNNFLETRDVEFLSHDKQLVPVLNAKYWRDLGLKPDASPTLNALADDKTVSVPGEYILDASARFNFNRLRLDLSIPQAALKFRAQDYVNPDLWDQGLPAAMLNYGLNYTSSSQSKGDGEYSNLFLRLDSGINLGAWRLRNNSTFTRNTGDQPRYDYNGNRISQKQVESRWQSLNTYLQRDIQSLGSQLTLGDSYTPGDLFDSVAFRGVQLATDDSQLPDSLRGFAPVVRGIARSSAQVIVQQNGTVIYQTTVAPGAFEIRDLYPTASSGNLDVTVRETDGSETKFVQPFSAVPGMQREGRLRYAVTGGKYRSWSDDVREPSFLQGTLQYGLTNLMTLYGGAMGSTDYQSGILGFGQGLGTFGSVSLDVTHANTQFENGPTRSGQSYRAQYAKDILQSGTSFVLAGYRYSTSGYYGFTEANELLQRGTSLDTDDELDYWRRTHNKRSRMQAQVTQRMGDYGSLSLTAYQQNYWGASGNERTLMLGYGFNYSGVNYSLNLSDTQYPTSDANRSLYFSVSVPLDKWLPGSRANYSLFADNKDRVRNQVSLSGLALDNRLSYSTSEGYANKGEGNSGNLNAEYRDTYGSVNGGYSYNRNSQQVSGGISGGVVAHPYGVTLSQPLGDTMALVRVPQANGVGVKNQRGVSTDGLGHAVVPYLTPYRKNGVSLRTETLPTDVDLQNAVRTVIPTRGALVLADYKANIGARVLANVTHHGKPIPFGATANLIVDGKMANSSFVGDSGDLYLSGVPEKSQVQVQWGKGADQQCRGDVALAPAEAGNRFRTASINCR